MHTHLYMCILEENCIKENEQVLFVVLAHVRTSTSSNEEKSTKMENHTAKRTFSINDMAQEFFTNSDF